MVRQTIIVVRQGNKYGPEYPEAIKKQLKRFNCPDYSFLVLGDGGDADIMLTTNATGWWSKMELFRPELRSFRPFTYIDLDVLITGDISNLKADDAFYICKEWMPGAKDHKRQSSVMIIPKDVDHIWNEYQKIVTSSYGGDQDFLEKFDHKILQDYFPDVVGSYKIHNIAKPVHKVIAFHGRPKPKDANGWAGEKWRYWMNESL